MIFLREGETRIIVIIIVIFRFYSNANEYQSTFKMYYVNLRQSFSI